MHKAEKRRRTGSIEMRLGIKTRSFEQSNSLFSTNVRAGRNRKRDLNASTYVELEVLETIRNHQRRMAYALSGVSRSFKTVST